MAKNKDLNKIKSSVFSRSLALAKLTATTGANLVQSRIQSQFKNEDEKKQQWQKFLTHSASSLAGELGELKGSLMKAGQLLSMYGEYFLPPEANEFLKSLQSNTPALAYLEIEKILLQELGPDKLNELEIDPKAIGTASLGQVHKAKIKKTGEIIVLKVQYPGVENAIESDLKALRSIMNLIKVLPKGPATDHIFNEIHSMLKQELNYSLEASQTQAYAKRLEGDPRFIVPKIYEFFCSQRVIASSYEKGVRADDNLILQLPQERRNKIGLSYLDLYFKELFEWGIVQTDPHLGNYAIKLNPKGNDQLILYDFGAVRSYPTEFLKPYFKMIQASLQNNKIKLREAALELQFIQPNDPPQLIEYFESFCLGTVEPFLEPTDERIKNDPAMTEDGTYIWKKSNLPNRLSQIVWTMIQKFQLRAPPQEILFLDRKTGGVFIFETVIQTQINGRNLLIPALEKGLRNQL